MGANWPVFVHAGHTCKQMGSLGLLHGQHLGMWGLLVLDGLAEPPFACLCGHRCLVSLHGKATAGAKTANWLVFVLANHKCKHMGSLGLLRGQHLGMWGPLALDGLAEPPFACLWGHKC